MTACIYLERGPFRPTSSAPSQPSWTRGVVGVSEERSDVSTCERVLLSFQLFSWNVSCMGSLVISTIFWTSLYNGAPLSSVDINAHIFLSCIMAIDQLLVASRFRLRDVWMTELFAVVYLTFNISYYFCAPYGQKLIYSILDWERDTLLAVTYAALTLFVLIPLFDLLHYGIFRLREYVYQMCLRRVALSPTALSDHLLATDDGSRQADSSAPTVQGGDGYVDV